MLEALQAGGLADAGDQFGLQEIGRGRHFRRVELCGEASKPMDVAGGSFGEVVRKIARPRITISARA